MEDILENVLYEIKSSGYEKKLIAGIVLTGGGAKLRHVSQLTEFVTHMDTRIGYPNEHLASSEKNEPIADPIFATAVGLVMWGLDKETPVETVEIEEPIVETTPETTPKKPQKQGPTLYSKFSLGLGKLKDLLSVIMDDDDIDKK